MKYIQSMIDDIKALHIAVENDVSAKTLTTFGSGGDVKHVVYPTTADELIKTIKILDGARYHVLGAGSKTIISDNGLDVVVCLKRSKGLTVDGERIRASAGEYLPHIAQEAQKHSLSGLEFAVGIPATLGGAIKMNAGAYDGQMKDVIESITLLKDGKIIETTPKDLRMSYRNGNLGKALAIEAVLKLMKADPEVISKKMIQNTRSRQNTQPTERSAGSVFKRTGAQSPAFYIQGCGLKGIRIGGAMISGKHCNFIVNVGGATSRDYLRLADQIKNAVRERYQIELEPEYIFLRD